MKKLSFRFQNVFRGNILKEIYFLPSISYLEMEIINNITFYTLNVKFLIWCFSIIYKN